MWNGVGTSAWRRPDLEANSMDIGVRPSPPTIPKMEDLRFWEYTMQGQTRVHGQLPVEICMFRWFFWPWICSIQTRAFCRPATQPTNLQLSSQMVGKSKLRHWYPMEPSAEAGSAEQAIEWLGGDQLWIYDTRQRPKTLPWAILYFLLLEQVFKGTSKERKSWVHLLGWSFQVVSGETNVAGLSC